MERDIRAGITIKKRLCFDRLPAILASLAFERFVRFTYGILIEQKELAQQFKGKVAFCVFFLVHYGRRERLFICLSLKNLLLDSTSGYKTVHET